MTKSPGFDIDILSLHYINCVIILTLVKNQPAADDNCQSFGGRCWPKSTKTLTRCNMAMCLGNDNIVTYYKDIGTPPVQGKLSPTITNH